MEDAYNVRCSVAMFCSSKMYDNIIYDKEIAECAGIKLDYPMKYVYDPLVKIYYTIMKGSPEMESKMGNSDIIIVGISQFGDNPVSETELYSSIARITNFTTESVDNGEE
jgi:hypothetical protein